MAHDSVGSLELMPLAEAFAFVPELKGIDLEQRQWLASVAVDWHLEPGEVIAREGDSATWMAIFLFGKSVWRRIADGPEAAVFHIDEPYVGGALPFSRMALNSVTGRALDRVRVALVHKDHFPEMMQRVPLFVERLVHNMSDRIREATRHDMQREKLQSLGKLAAGLAHELNNPAAAASRAASSLRQALRHLQKVDEQLEAIQLRDEALEALTSFEKDFIERVTSEQLTGTLVLDELTRSDREEELASWLARAGIKTGWEATGILVDSGVTVDQLAILARHLPKEAIGPALDRLAAWLDAIHLAEDIYHANQRISDLVGAIKEYSYLDQAAVQEIDVHRGIELTLKILNHRLRRGVSVDRDYDPNLPKIWGHGTELNQVWTNLIDNAIQAMDGRGKLTIKSCAEADFVVIRISDTGTGIPPAIRSKIYDPFFTTKAVGEGTGLGLDIVSRIIKSHSGNIRFDSEPGLTTFEVRLPLKGQSLVAD
jgi:signal transduction histidine kinase